MNAKITRHFRRFAFIRELEDNKQVGLPRCASGLQKNLKNQIFL